MIENFQNSKDDLCYVQNKNTLLKNDIADAKRKINVISKSQRVL